MTNIDPTLRDANVGDILGVVTYEIGSFYPQYQPPGREEETHGYLAEVVVHAGSVGEGIGPKLVIEAIQRLTQQYQIREIYAKRHADNAPSGRMMEKAGMEVLAEFDDPEIRPSGSRRTTVTRYAEPVS